MRRQATGYAWRDAQGMKFDQVCCEEIHVKLIANVQNAERLDAALSAALNTMGDYREYL